MSKVENFIKEHTKKSTNEIGVTDATNSHHYHEWLTPDDARKAVGIAREELIEWIEDNIEQYPVDNWDRFVKSLITDLKQAMKGE